MAELETAARFWKSAFERSTIDTHPTVWVGFFGYSYRGALWVNHRSRDALLWMAAPFAFCPEVQSVFLVSDLDRTLRITRLMVEGSGVRQSNWRLDYHLDDYGRLIFGMASWEYDSAFPIQAEALMNWRLKDGAPVDFDRAFSLAAQWGEYETV